jgi:hypothetical protein
MRKYSQFACVDWSGAKTERPTGIAVATMKQDGPPSLLAPHPRWSRADIRDWLLKLAGARTDILIGFDLSMALPFFDMNAYLPQWDASPTTPRDLWRLIDNICDDDPHLGSSSFVAHPEGKRHFRHSKNHIGDLFEGGTGRLRVVEQHQRDTKQAKSASCFNLIGAAQVGKSSLTGMRMLHQLDGAIPIWPFDPIPESGPVIVEIYTTVAAWAAGLPKGRSKTRNRAGLVQALKTLGSPAPARLASYDDHSTDALITAAWMQQAAQDERLWKPPAMTAEIAEKEGWTFGII